MFVFRWQYIQACTQILPPAYICKRYLFPQQIFQMSYFVITILQTFFLSLTTISMTILYHRQQLKTNNFYYTIGKLLDADGIIQERFPTTTLHFSCGTTLGFYQSQKLKLVSIKISQFNIQKISRFWFQGGNAFFSF